MIKVYGCSDDLVEIEGSSYEEHEIDCYNKDVRIRFVDGTVVRVGYPKRPDLGVWGIKVEKYGAANHFLKLCHDEDADPYSDILFIKAEIESVSVIKKKRWRP